jgi:hypothetical protein
VENRENCPDSLWISRNLLLSDSSQISNLHENNLVDDIMIRCVYLFIQTEGFISNDWKIKTIFVAKLLDIAD